MAAMGVDPGATTVLQRGTRMLAAWREWLHAFIARTARYGVVWVIVASFYSALVIYFREGAGVREPHLGSLYGFLIALPFGYLGHWGFTFQRRHRFLEGWQRFAAMNAVSFVVAVPGMHLVTHVFGG